MVIGFKGKKVVDINDKLKVIRLSEDEYTSLSEVEESILSNTTSVKITINSEPINTFIAFGKVEKEAGGISLFDVITDSIPFETIYRDGKKINSYKCFAGITGLKSNIIPHEDVGSSYNCLIEFLNYPKYVLVFN